MTKGQQDMDRHGLPVLDEAWTARTRAAARRAKRGIAVSLTITLAWLISVVVFGLWDRIVDQWAASATMVFGSIVAGSTPQGGGAVAFPVFTKVLNVPTEIARTFSLCIQAVGMSAAALSIIINRRPVEWRSVGITTAAAVVGFLSVGFLGSHAALPYRPAALPGPYVKITFTIVLTAMAFVVYTGTRVRLREVHRVLPPLNARMATTLVVVGMLGGIASALVGSGSDVFVYLGLVVFFTIDPKVGVPSSVICMAILSIVGFIAFGLVDGQLFVQLNHAGEVVGVAGKTVSMSEAGTMIYGAGTPAPAGRFDLFGLWLAAVPVVCWGAPLGSWLASQMSTRSLVGFVSLLAVAEIVSTAIFLEELHTDRFLLVYAVVGTAATLAVLHLVAKHRAVLFRLPDVDIEQSLHSDRVDVSSSFREVGRPEVVAPT